MPLLQKGRFGRVHNCVLAPWAVVVTLLKAVNYRIDRTIGALGSRNAVEQVSDLTCL